jgi:HSP20 family protein
VHCNDAQRLTRLLDPAVRVSAVFGAHLVGVSVTLPIVVEAVLPGVDEKDVSVTLANGVLTIKGEKKQRKEKKGENYPLTERSVGSFERAVHLPDTVDDAKLEARFDKGVLKVTAAKKPHAMKAERKIAIKRG